MNSSSAPHRLLRRDQPGRGWMGSMELVGRVGLKIASINSLNMDGVLYLMLEIVVWAGLVLGLLVAVEEQL